MRNHKAQSFHILFEAMYSVPLYKSCQPCPRGPYRPHPGGRHGKNFKKSSSPKPQGPKLSFHILFLAMYSGPLFNPANCAPGVHTGPAPGASWEKHKKPSSPKPYGPFHMLCGPMYNTLLYKCCQRCPWGPYRPRLRHVIIYHRLIMEIYEKISATA